MAPSRLPVLIISGILALFPPLALATCQQSALRIAADLYYKTQTSADIDASFLGTGVQYLENSRQVDIKTGLLSQKLAVDYVHSIIDQDGCAVFTELIVTNPANPYVINAQIFYKEDAGAPSGDHVDVLKVDTVVATTGDWEFNATARLAYVSRENWGPLNSSRPQQDDARASIQAAADAYLDLWTKGNSERAVPWAAPCSRLDGGNTYWPDECAVGLVLPASAAAENTNRRYVIDETVGAASVFCDFGSLGNAPDSHEFRVVGGRIRYVHQITATKGDIEG
ncbi:hypothetical protein B0H63DRAFT_399684 [Podospora didyma]|uniref:DUF8021 domain-containing protein n=1 Tax=Podospora didyma TaxID=330526 RepID=A0AAE0KET2_9PEZI|nr:hypothetical protein B0H63DRAFT_399684 [Podospora didyma]